MLTRRTMCGGSTSSSFRRTGGQMLVQRIAARYTVAAFPPLNEPRLGRSSSALRNSERRPVEIGVRHPEGEIYFHVFRHAKPDDLADRVGFHVRRVGEFESHFPNLLDYTSRLMFGTGWAAPPVAPLIIHPAITQCHTVAAEHPLPVCFAPRPWFYPSHVSWCRA